MIEKFEEFTIGRADKRDKYYSKNQEPNEGIVAYITALQNLAKTCNFGTLHDSLLGDKIVFSVLRKHTRQKLLQERKLTLKKCIDVF